jgi:HSP20 family molecular chaperone IbpA
MSPDSSSQAGSAGVRIVRKLSAAYERMEEQVRERAYQIFQKRAPHEGDPEKDWLDAQLQLLTPINLVVKDHKKNVVIEGDFKKFSPQEIEVEVGPGGLKVFGLHTESTTARKKGVTGSSARTVHLYQAVPLPCAVTLDGGKAILHKNGKLKITLPKSAN